MSSSTKPNINRDFLDPNACPHYECYHVPTTNTVQKRQRHFNNASAHAAKCAGSNCSTCFRLWGCLANEHVVMSVAIDQKVSLARLKELAESQMAVTAARGAPPKSMEATPRSSYGGSSTTSTPHSIPRLTDSLRGTRRRSSSGGSAADVSKEIDFSMETQNSTPARAATDADTAIKLQVFDNLVSILTAQPHNSQLRRGLIQELLQDVDCSHRSAAKIFNLKKDTIRRAVDPDLTSNNLVHINRLPNSITRRVYEENVEGAAVEYWYSQCRQTRSIDSLTGDRKDLWLYDIDQEEVWLHYRSHMVQLNLLEIESESQGAECELDDEMIEIKFELMRKRRQVVSRSKFIYLRPANVRKGEMRRFACEICRDGFENREELAEAKEADYAKMTWKEMNELEEKFKAHREAIKRQRSLFQSLVKKGVMKQGECLLLFDFSPYCAAYHYKQSLSEGMGTIQCLHVVVYVGVANEDAERRYYDFFASDSNDHHFFRYSMLDLLAREEMRHLKPLYFFSDGGPKHFKIAKSIGFVCVELAIHFGWSFTPVWNFFASHHGKSAADARAARCKYFLKRLATRRIASVGAHGIAKSINEEKDEKMSARNATAYSAFDHKDDFEWDFKGQIRKYHSFQCVNVIGVNGNEFELSCWIHV